MVRFIVYASVFALLVNIFLLIYREFFLTAAVVAIPFVGPINWMIHPDVFSIRDSPDGLLGLVLSAVHTISTRIALVLLPSVWKRASIMKNIFVDDSWKFASEDTFDYLSKYITYEAKKIYLMRKTKKNLADFLDKVRPDATNAIFRFLEG